MLALAALPAIKFFDKFIHVEFEKYMSVADAKTYYEQEELKKQRELLARNAAHTKLPPTDAQWEGFLDRVTGKFRIETPRAGVKPHIAVSAKFIPFMRTSEVTLSIKNVEIDVNINQFTFMRVRMGYFNGPSVMFRGAIMNSYVENPNPNGNTVFQMLATGILEDMLSQSAITAAAFGPTYWIKGLETICAALYFPLDRSHFHHAYDKIPLMDEPKKRLTFTSKKAVIDYFQDAANVLFPQYGLRPPTISLNAETITVTSNDNGVILTNVKEVAQELDMIKTASFTGGGIMIKAPYNPFITPLSYFHIDPKYFRGRFHSQNMRTAQNILGSTPLAGLATSTVDVQNGEAAVKQDLGVGVAEDGYYKVLNMSVQFDTYNVNEMQVLGVMANATRDNSETLDKTITEYQNITPEPPHGYPPFFEETAQAGQSSADPPVSAPIVISENKTERVPAARTRRTLSTILNTYINEPFAQPKYAIDFKIGDKHKMYINPYQFNLRTANGVFAASRRNWFHICDMLMDGDKDKGTLVGTLGPSPASFGENVFGADAQSCLQGLTARCKQIDREYNIPNGVLFGSVYSVFCMLCQRSWFNAAKDSLEDAVAPYVSGYILPGEQLLARLRIAENDVYCDNDFIYDNIRKSTQIKAREYPMHLAGPDWARCLKKDRAVAALFRELAAWAETKTIYSFEWADFVLAASWFTP
jgi:hypothetical protein